jgi:hypothetical protein
MLNVSDLLFEVIMGASGAETICVCVQLAGLFKVLEKNERRQGYVGVCVLRLTNYG